MYSGWSESSSFIYLCPCCPVCEIQGTAPTSLTKRFINLLYKRAVFDPGFSRPAQNVLYESICLWEYRIPHTSDETHLIHLLLRASVLCSCSLAGPHVSGASTWRSAPAQAAACDPSLGHQPPAAARTAPVQTPRRELQAASTASPMQLDASSFSSCSYRGLPLSFLFTVSSFTPLQGLVPFRSCLWELEVITVP